MATIPAKILGTLDDLTDDEFKTFKWHLLNGGLTNSSIPRGMLEKADRRDVVDLMVQQYKEPEAGEIAVAALREIKQNERANQLETKLQKGPSDGASSGGTTGTAPTTGVSVNISSSSGGTVKAPVLQGGVFHGTLNFN